MNDEATVHYMTTINQMTYGLGILKGIIRYLLLLFVTVCICPFL